ncbi:DUF2934 domain-containing protein [Dyella sp. 7MK23]|uniref:DUF2934 domain-containing protein n=2 Tax=Dyella acidiphila TaxID=2775866 RepID=A0ABR9GBY2_9GAMM|nr:DUF2934 domain-containing protein [Dyella acidiphila]MBE1161514.1 DUF2934 domain-containing protein [Dyella acidiphila]
MEDGDDRARISALAHAMWESEGRPDGRDLEHWLKAEKLVDAQREAALVVQVHGKDQAGS